MTIAIVDLATGQFKHTTNKPIIKVDEFNILEVAKVPREQRLAYGWFDFVPTQPDPPAGQKAQGTTYTVDLAAGTVTENHLYVDMTQEEIKDANNRPLDAQILSLEKQAIELGFLRTVMEDLQSRFVAAAVAANITEDQLLDPDHPAHSPSYAKLHKNITDRAALRAQRI